MTSHMRKHMCHQVGRLTLAHQTLNDDADERLAAYVYLVNSDQNKYGSVIKNLNSQKSLKNDKFPKTVTDAHNVLINHVPEKEKNKKDVQKICYVPLYFRKIQLSTNIGLLIKRTILEISPIVIIIP